LYEQIHTFLSELPPIEQDTIEPSGSCNSSFFIERTGWNFLHSPRYSNTSYPPEVKICFDLVHFYLTQLKDLYLFRNLKNSKRKSNAAQNEKLWFQFTTKEVIFTLIILYCHNLGLHWWQYCFIFSHLFVGPGSRSFWLYWIWAPSKPAHIGSGNYLESKFRASIRLSRGKEKILLKVILS